MAETTYTNIGAKYYLEYTQLVIPVDANKYRSLPVNSEFSVKSTFFARVYNAFGSYTVVHAEDLVFSGYDMSTRGFQDVIVSYTCPNNQVLTTTITLHVYGTSSWRTLWSGTEHIEYYSDTSLNYYCKINDVVQSDVTNIKALPITTNEEIIRKYIGNDGSRKLRVTCSINDTSLINHYKVGGEERSLADSYLHSYTFDYNVDNQIGTSATYAQILDGLTFTLLNKTDNVYHDYQAFYTILGDNITSGTDSILTLYIKPASGSIKLAWFDFTITKIEVQE